MKYAARPSRIQFRPTAYIFALKEPRRCDLILLLRSLARHQAMLASNHPPREPLPFRDGRGLLLFSSQAIGAFAVKISPFDPTSDI